MSTEIKTLDINELAPLLKREVSTLYRDMKRRPQSVPAPLRIPGSARLIWLQSDVLDWLESCRVKTGGRPRKITAK